MVRIFYVRSLISLMETLRSVSCCRAQWSNEEYQGLLVQFPALSSDFSLIKNMCELSVYLSIVVNVCVVSEDALLGSIRQAERPIVV